MVRKQNWSTFLFYLRELFKIGCSLLFIFFCYHLCLYSQLQENFFNPQEVYLGELFIKYRDRFDFLYLMFDWSFRNLYQITSVFFQYLLYFFGLQLLFFCKLVLGLSYLFLGPFYLVHRLMTFFWAYLSVFKNLEKKIAGWSDSFGLLDTDFDELLKKYPIKDRWVFFFELSRDIELWWVTDHALNANVRFWKKHSWLRKNLPSSFVGVLWDFYNHFINGPRYAFSLGKWWFILFSGRTWLDFILWVLNIFAVMVLELFFFLIKPLNRLSDYFKGLSERQWEHYPKHWLYFILKNEKMQNIWYLLCFFFDYIVVLILKHLVSLYFLYVVWLKLLVLIYLIRLFKQLFEKKSWDEKGRLLLGTLVSLLKLSLFYIYFYYFFYLVKVIFRSAKESWVSYREIYDHEKIEVKDLWFFFFHRLINILLLFILFIHGIFFYFVIHFGENLKVDLINSSPWKLQSILFERDRYIREQRPFFDFFNLFF